MNRVVNSLFIKRLIDNETFLKLQNADNQLELIYDYYKMNNKNIDELVNIVEEIIDMKYVNLKRMNITKDIINSISTDIRNKYNINCINKSGNEISIVTSKPFTDREVYNNMMNDLYPLKVNTFFAFQNEIDDKLKKIEVKKDKRTKNLKKIDRKSNNESKSKEEFTINPKDSMKKVNLIIQAAIKKDSSDIHIEPLNSDKIRIRIRIDGDLCNLNSVIIYPQEYNNIVSRIKVMAELDPSEKRKSQDGKIANFIYEDVAYDLRVSSMFTILGEKIVIRIIRKITNNKNLKHLGFNEEESIRIEKLIKRQNGILLVTGETGSGKSTSVYTLINMLNKENVNICTVEDPVESEIEGVSQVQVNELAEITFVSALKTFLRQDPDIILVGEIRDYITAETAIKAANTGHLVLTTIHTNNTTSTINRLISMGIEAYKISEGINGIMSQRLVKKLCPHCKRIHELNNEEYNKFKEVLTRHNIGNIDDLVFYEANVEGCNYCNQGYKGRIVIPEILEFNEEVNTLISKNYTSVELRSKIITNRNIFLPFEQSVFLKKDMIAVDTIKEFL